jgi:hypothetical protein
VVEIKKKKEKRKKKKRDQIAKYLRGYSFWVKHGQE